jgi:hypothetical protein
MLHRSPREFGRQSSLWTLELAVVVAFEEGITKRRVSGETIRATLSRLLGERRQRAKRWMTSPDPLYERKRGYATDWWRWPRPAPNGPWASRMNAGGAGLLCRAEEGKAMRLVQQSIAKDDPEPKVISCYGLYVPQLDERWLRFVEERPWVL